MIHEIERMWIPTNPGERCRPWPIEHGPHRRGASRRENDEVGNRKRLELGVGLKAARTEMNGAIEDTKKRK
jgi:hypothetical protein